jgi:hypothetical protein
MWWLEADRDAGSNKIGNDEDAGDIKHQKHVCYYSSDGTGAYSQSVFW